MLLLHIFSRFRKRESLFPKLGTFGLLSEQNLYNFAGINDLAEFYRLRYASGEILEASYFDAVNRFDIRWSRTMWIYDNVRRGSSVLDLGCGAGVLALLKRKTIFLAGIDISADCAAVAQQNGYDQTHTGNLTNLPFADQSFDYVVSLDVMGHIEFAEKDKVLAEIKSVLKPDGITMHGVECMNRAQQKDYTEMSDEELRRFISVDGHVGMEDEAANARRFGRFFKHLRTEPRYSVCVPCEELIKLAEDYELPRCDQDFLDYLRGLSANERRAFNIGNGLCLRSYFPLPDQDARQWLPAGKAPTAARDIYGEHLDRSDLFPSSIRPGPGEPICLDRSAQSAFCQRLVCGRESAAGVHAGWDARERFDSQLNRSRGCAWT